MKYEFRGPKVDYSDWSTATSDAPAPSVLVVSARGSTIIDVQKTNAAGEFQIEIAAVSDPNDLIFFFPMVADPTTGGIAIAMADPVFPADSTQTVGSTGTSPKLWFWSTAVANVSEGATVRVTESAGSGVLRVFDYIRYAYERDQQLTGKRGISVIVWLGFGTSWSCGTCFAQYPNFTFGLAQSQMWLSGNRSDTPWWSDAVTAHEMGHWAMASYGVSPNEGGAHYLRKPSQPGLGWSEGWATWHSADTRSDSFYFDKQNGSMFWLDLATNRYGSGLPWQLPTPSLGLLQNLDENEVSSILWTISRQPSVTASKFFDAMRSSRMTKSPWARGYTRHSWSVDGQGNVINPVDLGVPAPALPDFLDALVCGGVSAAAIDTGTVPASQYPYPSAQPICR